MVDAVLIRPGELKDAKLIAEYNQAMAWETEHKHLDLPTVNRGVARVFGDPKKGFYLVAESKGKMIGQLMVTFEWSDWRDGWFWWIQSVYVKSEYRRQGIFRKLFDSAVQQAKLAGDVVGIRLYVEQDNKKAQATYAGLGMKNPGYFVEELMFDQ